MTNRFGALLAATVVLLGTALTACSTPQAATPDVGEPTESAAPTPSAAPPASEEAASEAPGEEEVRIDGSAFDPEELTVAVGTEVVWVNADGFAHTVTEGTDGRAVDDPIVDEEIVQDGMVRVTFDEPGTYDITCAFHPTMQMTVIVEG